MIGPVTSSRWKHLRAITVLPGTVTVLVPATILHFTRQARLAPAPRIGIAAAGLLLIVVGLGLMVRTIRLFARIGEGTLAPWDPTQKLVVRGVYRYVRNPMITGVMSVLLGEAAFFGSPALLGWFVAFAMVNMIFIPLWEEPGLERRFGADYREYKRHVPRWIPRLTPWTPQG